MSKTSRLADDFSRVAHGSEQNLVRLLHRAVQEQPPPSSPSDTDHSPRDGLRSRTDKPSPPQAVQHPVKTGPPKRPRKTKRPRPSAGRDDSRWSPATSSLNTRLPPEMVELLDDLVYRLKKQRRTPITKQSLTMEAIERLLESYEML